MYLKRNFKRILGLFQIFCFALLISLVIPKKVIASPTEGLGTIGFRESREIAPGVVYERLASNNVSGEQKAYTVVFGSDKLIPVATYGANVYGGSTLSKMIDLEEAKGTKVVAAINGDFYDTSNSIPIGAMIINGRFVTSGNTNSIGFKADGTAVHGQTNFSIKYNDGSKDVAINHVNKDRKTNTTSVFLYTEDYGTSTKSTLPGTEVVLTISGSLKVGQSVNATVKSVHTNTTNTAINKGEIVIGVHSDSATKISNLTVGKQISITVTDNTNRGWKDVVQSLGAGVVLVENGQLPAATAADKAVHPRTAIGIKADGSYVLFQVDGRQPGLSNGLSYEQMYHFLVNEHNCVYAYNLDGGGSSTISVRLPGDPKASVQNSPSDGRERNNANGILFVSKQSADPNKTVSHIHSYPRELIILEKGNVNLDVKATDKNFFPVTKPTNITYTANNNIGTVDANGKFVARTGSGVGTVTITSGTITETVNVKVVDSIDKMTADKTFISVAPGAKMQINVNAYKESMPISAGNSAFTWSLSSSSLGTVTQDGLFTGTNGSATGTINVSYKTFKIEIPVEVGTAPKMITTFEDVIMRPNSGYNWDWTIENPTYGGKGSASINEDERYIKFGNKSLRIDYDFREASGTTAVSTFLKAGGNGAPGSKVEQYLQLEGYPTHIGMWVYGDNKGANIKMQLRDANNKVQYINFAPEVVNWTGWKYIEAPIPVGLASPLYLQYAIRVMSVAGNVKSNGTLYFDNFRAVYGFKNDDVLNPLSGDPTPANGAVVTDKTQKISLKVWDDKSGINTGIRKESIKMWLNDKLVDNLILSDNEDLSITLNYTPSALTPYSAGPQNVKVRFEDNYGNISFKTWSFTVAGNFVEVNGQVVPNKDVIYNGEKFKYIISSNKYSDFTRLTGKIQFNASSLQIEKAEVLDDGINVVKNVFNNTTGLYEFEIGGMNELNNIDNPQLIEITFAPKPGFTAGADTAVIPKDVKVYETNNAEGRIVQLPNFEKTVDYKYRISYPTSTVGRTMVFTILDDKLNPVSGAGLEVVGASVTVTTLSDANGLIVTDAFKQLPVNTKFNVIAVKDGLKSEAVAVEILPSLGTPEPDFVVLTPGVDGSKSAVITWKTNLLTTSGEVMYRVKGTSNWLTSSSQTTKEIKVINTNVQTQEYLAHRVELTNLAPNTEYEYRVGTTSYYSAINTFTTAKTDGELDILFLGDPQSSNVTGYNLTKALMEAAFSKKPNINLGLVAGDLVEDVNSATNWDALNQVLGSYFNSMMWSSATGNHDVIRSYSDPFIWSMSGPRNGVDGVIGANYFFEYGDIALAVIDTETPNKFSDQQAWLINKMNNSNMPFKIVLMHRSVYPTFNTDDHVRAWYNTFDQAKVDLVLSGHDHVYNRTSMKANNKIEVGLGTVYVSGGSAGPKFYNASNLDARPWVDVLYDDDNNVYSLINIKNNVLTFEAYALVNGVSEKIDSFVINKRTDGTNIINVDTSGSVNSENMPISGTGTGIVNVTEKNSEYGNTNDLIAISNNDYKFSFYMENGYVLSTSSYYSFITSGDHNFLAFFRPANKVQIVVVDANNKYLGSLLVDLNTELTAQDIDKFKNKLINRPGYEFEKWSINFPYIVTDELTVVKAIYSTISPAEHTITVVGNNNQTILEQPVIYGKTITISAPFVDGLEFSHWQIGDEVLSYDQTHTLSVYYDLTIKAIYKDTVAITPNSYLHQNVIVDRTKMIFLVQNYLPVGYEVIEQGLIYLNTSGTVSKDILIGDTGVIRIRAIRVSPHSEYAILNDTLEYHNLYLRSYLVVRDESNNIAVIYSSQMLKSFKYKVNYVLDGGTNHPNNKDVYSIYNPITLENPTRSGHIFKGWYLNNEFSGQVITSIDKLTADITLYAKWEQEKAGTLRVETKDGSTIEAGVNTNQLYVYDEADNSISRQDCEFISSDPSIATVSSYGTIMTYKPGTVTITVRYEGMEGTIVLTITEPVTPVTITVVAEPGSTIPVGASGYQIKIKDGSGSEISRLLCTFTSSDSTVATVSSYGTITAHKVGTTVITVKYQDATATITLTVVNS